MVSYVRFEENWLDTKELPAVSFQCGFCGNQVSSNKGYKFGKPTDDKLASPSRTIVICPYCQKPSFITKTGEQFPSPAIGHSVAKVPELINTIYEEARQCATNRCYTASVMICRKILMHIAVEKGAKENLKFFQYVDYLSERGYIPPDGKGWVNRIKDKGNEANHEIKTMDSDDAQDLITFVEMLLIFIYKFPEMLLAK